MTVSNGNTNSAPGNGTAAPGATPGQTSVQGAPAQGAPAGTTTVESSQGAAVAAAAGVMPSPYILRAPEGVAVQARVIETIGASAARLGVTQEAAQRLLEELAPAIPAAAQDQHASLVQAWKTAAAADDRLKAIPADVQETRIQRVLARGSEAVRATLHNSGLIHHPEIRDLILKLEEGLSDDRRVVGSQPARSEPKRVGGVMSHRDQASVMAR